MPYSFILKDLKDIDISNNFDLTIDLTSQVDKSVMNSEAARRLTYFNWPHNDSSKYLKNLFIILFYLVFRVQKTYLKQAFIMCQMFQLIVLNVSLVELLLLLGKMAMILC